MKKLENVRELLKTLKHRKPTRIYCPRCCSPKIHPTSSFNNWLIPSKYVCSNCGYTGSIVMELEQEEEKSENKNA
jgi:transposase-like protein